MRNDASASVGELKLFLKVVEAGSITSAAQQLGMAKSAVSTRIAELESAVGVRLLSRSKKGVAPTAAGERMAAHGKDLLASIDRALEDVRRDEREPSGQVRISVPAGIADEILVPALARFLEQHPRIRLDILATDGLVDLRQAGVDVALRFGWIQTGDFVARKLATFTELLVASPGYLRANEPIRGVPDLARHAWVGYTGFGGTSQRLQVRTQGGTPQQVVVECRLRTSNAPSQRAWVLAGLGITRLPRFLVERDLVSGALECVLPDITLDGPSLYAVYLPERYRPAAVTALLSFLDGQQFGQ